MERTKQNYIRPFNVLDIRSNVKILKFFRKYLKDILLHKEYVEYYPLFSSSNTYPTKFLPDILTKITHWVSLYWESFRPSIDQSSILMVSRVKSPEFGGIRQLSDIWVHFNAKNRKNFKSHRILIYTSPEQYFIYLWIRNRLRAKWCDFRCSIIWMSPKIMRNRSYRHDVRSRISPKEKLGQTLSVSYSMGHMANVHSLLTV